MKKATCFYLSLTTATLLVALVPFNACAAAGDVYEADFGNGAIFKFAPNGTSTVFTSGLINPSGLAFDANANLFVADFGSGKIFKFTPDGTRTTFASGLNKPFGLAFDAAGNLFEGDRSGTIFKFSPSGTKTTFATGLNIPAGLAFDPSGNLFETDFGSGNIFKFTVVGAQSTFASGLISPDAITIDTNGNVFCGDPGGGNVFKITPAGVKSTYASGFSQPTGLVFDAAANLFVSDNAAGTISKVAPDGTKSTFATGLSNPQNLAIEPATVAKLGNISTRLEVGTGSGVLIGGFIIEGTSAKKVLIRAIGPSLPSSIQNRITNPSIELHDSGQVIARNDDWQTTEIGGAITADQAAEIENSTLAPGNPAESAMIVTLPPGDYTAIVQGPNGEAGVGTVEVYDLNQGSPSSLANISTRGSVGTGSGVLIGGFIVQGTSSRKVLIRAIGPSLPSSIQNRITNPSIELHDSGQVIARNDDWQTTEIGSAITADQAAEIQNSTLAPGNPAESAMIVTLPPGGYTAIVQGPNGETGVGTVEVYAIN